MRRLLESVDVKVDVASMLRLPSTDDLRALVDRVREGGLVTLMAGPERMAIIDEMQAAMAVVEGHAEHVMDAVGVEALDSLDELRSALDRRRAEKPPALRLLEKLFGLELKMRQYELGKAFCDAVVEQEGIEALDRVWSGPEALPSLAELELPQMWLDRTRPRAA
jgi:putative hydrolase